jgi:hypothetical protein
MRIYKDEILGYLDRIDLKTINNLREIMKAAAMEMEQEKTDGYQIKGEGSD